jgi:hypothetical protein
LALAVSLIIGSSCLVFLSSYAYYVNDWARIVVIPFVGLGGVLLWVLFFVWARMGLLCERALLFAPLAWLCAWTYLARPNGIWVWIHSRQAYASFYIPDSANDITRKGPQPCNGASYQLEFVSEESMDNLIAFYLKKIGEAKLPLTAEQDTRNPSNPLNHVHQPYYPMYILSFHNRGGQKCVVCVFDNTPRKGREHWRTVRLECNFEGPFLNPPIFAL